MAVARLSVEWREVQEQTTRLESLTNSLSSLNPNHRKLVAEISLVRLFLLFENTMASVAAKLLIGADYIDGTQPLRLVSARSRVHANDLMKTHGRKKATKLGWTQSSDIRDNLVHTLGPLDPFFTIVANNGALFTEMRYVRNHVVHSNESTLKNFRTVVRKHYGGLKQGVSPGLILLTDRIGRRPLLVNYILAIRVMFKDLVRA